MGWRGESKPNRSFAGRRACPIGVVGIVHFHDAAGLEERSPHPMNQESGPALIIGGALAVFRATGAVDAAMGALLRRWGDRPFWLVAGGVSLFAVGSATIGFGEEYFPFVPVLITLALTLGYDRVTAVAIIMVGYTALPSSTPSPLFSPRTLRDSNPHRGCGTG